MLATLLEIISIAICNEDQCKQEEAERGRRSKEIGKAGRGRKSAEVEEEGHGDDKPQ